MPRAFDRRKQSTSDLDHSPLQGLLNYEEIDETARTVGNPIQILLGFVLNLFGLGGLLDFVNRIVGGGDLDEPADVWGNIANLFLKPLGIFAEIVGGLISAALIPILDATKVLGLPALINGVFGFWNSLWGALTGATAPPAENVSPDAVVAAMAAQTDTIVGNAALLEQLRAENSPGNMDADDFERTEIGPAWTVLKTQGTVAILDGHNVSYDGVGNASEYLMYKNDVVAEDNTMKSTIVLNEPIPAWPWPPFVFGGEIDVWICVKAAATFATREGVRFRVYSAGGYSAIWYLHNVVNGVETQLATGTIPVAPSAGSALSIENGVDGNERLFQMTINNTPVAEPWLDSGNVITLDANHRYRGFGGHGRTNVDLITVASTPSIRHWTATG